MATQVLEKARTRNRAAASETRRRPRAARARHAGETGKVSQGKKAELIKAAYTLLAENRPQDISIRSIAAAADCTTGAVYRQFNGAEHLIRVACVKFLEDYMADLNDILLMDDRPLDQHIAMWRSFGKQAFGNVDAFDLMFWGMSEDDLNDAIFEYYQEFPESWRKLSGFQVMLFFSSSISERNLLTLNRCMAEYNLNKSTVEMINDIEICSFHGLMMEYRDCYREPGKPEEGLERYMEMLDYLLGLVQKKQGTG